MNKFLFLFLYCMAFSSLALEGDRDAAIEVEADKVDINYAEGIAAYTGNVKLAQGSIVITASSILISTEKNQMQQVEILGGSKPATFQQRISQGQKISAQAMKILFKPNEDDISFIDDAVIEEDNNTIKAPYIVYNSRTHKIIANNQGNEQERIHMKFTPKATTTKENNNN